MLSIVAILELFTDVRGHVSDLITPALTYDILHHTTLIADNIFEENFSGIKGSAIYLKQ